MTGSVAYAVQVRGLVQGVSFRWGTQRRAVELGVSGWVSNEPDGSVHAHVEGPAPRVEQMLAWLAQGPPGAVVEDLVSTGVEAEGLTGFEVRG